MRILACSDLQLGAGRTVATTLADQERWLGQIVEHSESADLFLMAGDAFENRQTNRDQDEVFMRFLLAVSRNCPILLVGGNHDWRGYERASTIGIFAANGIEVALTPGVHRYGDVAIACLPHASTGYLLASNGGGDRANANAEAAAHLVAIAEGLRSQIESHYDYDAILAGHWAVTGASLPTGLPVEQLSEPVIEIADLAAQRWDAIALGHIHRAQLIDAAVPAFYCGSPYPCSWGEADDEHGVWLLEPDPVTANAGERALWVPRFVPIESRPLSKWNIDADVALEWGAPGGIEGHVVKFTIAATPEQASRFDVAAFKRSLYDAGAHHVAAVNVEVERVERARVEGLTEELSEIEALDVWMGAQGVNGTKADALRERTTRYLEAVRS